MLKATRVVESIETSHPFKPMKDIIEMFNELSLVENYQYDISEDGKKELSLRIHQEAKFIPVGTVTNEERAGSRIIISYKTYMPDNVYSSIVIRSF